MAAYDLAGKMLSTPVHNLLGGKVRDAIPLSWSLPLVDADAAVHEGVQMIKQGWRILKLKMGRPNYQSDIDVARAVRHAVGADIGLRADANQAYDTKTALRVIAELEPVKLDFFEQPTAMNDIESLRTVTRAATVPIMADKSATTLDGIARLALRRAVDAVSIYVIGPGGLNQSKKMAALAEAHNLRGYVGGALETVVGAVRRTSPCGIESLDLARLRDEWPVPPQGIIGGDANTVRRRRVAGSHGAGPGGKRFGGGS